MQDAPDLKSALSKDHIIESFPIHALLKKPVWIITPG